MGSGAVEALSLLFLGKASDPEDFDIEELARRSKDIEFLQERIVDIIAAGVAKGISKAFGG